MYQIVLHTYAWYLPRGHSLKSDGKRFPRGAEWEPSRTAAVHGWAADEELRTDVGSPWTDTRQWMGACMHGTWVHTGSSVFFPLDRRFHPVTSFGLLMWTNTWKSHWIPRLPMANKEEMFSSLACMPIMLVKLWSWMHSTITSWTGSVPLWCIHVLWTANDESMQMSMNSLSCRVERMDGYMNYFPLHNRSHLFLFLT
jgi:hypothetical protein